MDRLAQLTRALAARKTRRPLVAALLAGLLFELSLLAGVLASPFVQAWTPAALAPMDNAAAMLARWRQGLSRRESDPRLGGKAPELDLRAPAGQPVTLADLRGKKVALLFVPGGGG